MQVVKTKKFDAVGSAYYGKSFTGYQKLSEITDLIPAFKDFYYEAKIKDHNARLAEILQNFNRDICEPVNRKFHPYTTNVRVWRAKWDLDLMQQMKNKEIMSVEGKNVYQVIKTRDADKNLLLGIDDGALEAGVKTLGGELLNDAMQMLKDDQELDEVYTTEELVKRRNYIVGVFSHVTRLVHGKATLMLKASAEKRENVSFLMDLLAQATSGEMTNEQLELLEASNAKPVETTSING